MAGTQKDIKLIEYKDTIKQLNMTVKSQNELILSLKTPWFTLLEG